MDENETLQARLKQCMNQEFPDVQARFENCRGTRGQIANICWIIEKARAFQKTSISASLTVPYPFFVDHNKLWKILKEKGITDHLICLLRNQIKKQQLEMDMEQ